MTFTKADLVDHLRNALIKKQVLKSNEQKIIILRKALTDFVGVESREDLEALEPILRSRPGIEQDKVVGINAIHALLQTMEE